MTDVEKRERVEEWRVTRHPFAWTVRFWVERDPAHGGLASYEAAEDAVDLAIVATTDPFEAPSRMEFARLYANALIDACKVINSVEVCDSGGDGATVHRDWP